MANKIVTLPKGYILKSPLHTYRIESVLGCGGFGITYLANATIMVGNVSLNVKFAIKEHFISSDCERNLKTNMVVYSNPVRERVENSRKDFIAEAKRLHKVGVSHPNIVKVNEVFETNNTAYYVMEYLDGESLRSFVKTHGVMNDSQIMAIMCPIVEAVQYLHKNRMTHLDIKPDNIMLTHNEDGGIRPVLIDFGLSKHYDKEGRPTSTINTLGCSDGYAPIEQYAGITQFSPSADIYALGATMYFCITGKNPNKSTELEEGELASSIESLSKEISSVVREACVLNKNKRRINLFNHISLDEANTDKSVTLKIEPSVNSSKYELFSLNKKQKRIAYVAAVVIFVILEILAIGKGGFYWFELSDILRDIGLIMIYALYLYGLINPREFIESKFLKFLWASVFFFSLYTLGANRSDSFDELMATFAWSITFVCCYELVVNKIPKYSQIWFAIVTFLSLLFFK